MLPFVIVNPKSAGGATRDKWSATASDLRAHFGPFKVAFTKTAGDGTRLAEKAANAGHEFIIACGGDGTINEAANGILRSGRDVELGILPSGTGGDLRRSIDMPMSARESAMILRTGRTRKIDVGKVTFDTGTGERAERYFLNVSSAGLAASIIDRVKQKKALGWLPPSGVRGRAAFALSALQEFAALETFRLRVRFDDEEPTTLTTLNFCVANARFFGGGMKIAPEAKLADGLFDIVNIGDINTARVLLNAYTLYSGTHVSLKEVRTRHAKRVRIEPADDTQIIRIEVDGELPGRLPAEYEIVPKALRLRVPAKR
jgi:YegS/Rv2252/BmrU family lipid kinase